MDQAVIDTLDALLDGIHPGMVLKVLGWSLFLKAGRLDSDHKPILAANYIKAATSVMEWAEKLISIIDE